MNFPEYTHLWFVLAIPVDLIFLLIKLCKSSIGFLSFFWNSVCPGILFLWLIKNEKLRNIIPYQLIKLKLFSGIWQKVLVKRTVIIFMNQEYGRKPLEYKKLYSNCWNISARLITRQGDQQVWKCHIFADILKKMMLKINLPYFFLA